MGREKSTTCHTYIHTYIAGESTWYYEREEESRNRKRFTRTRTSPRILLIVSRVEEARGTNGIASICFIQPHVSGAINVRAFPIVRSSSLGLEYV